MALDRLQDQILMLTDINNPGYICSGSDYGYFHNGKVKIINAETKNS
jgi:hypothetical protein